MMVVLYLNSSIKTTFFKEYLLNTGRKKNTFVITTNTEILGFSWTTYLLVKYTLLPQHKICSKILILK